MMGEKAMKVWSWRQAIEGSDLKPMTKLVLYTLANHMNEHGKGSFPSVSRISKACGIQNRAIYRHLDEAEKLGFLVRKKRHLEGQKWASNEYEATYPQGVSLETPLKEEYDGKNMPETKEICDRTPDYVSFDANNSAEMCQRGVSPETGVSPGTP